VQPWGRGLAQSAELSATRTDEMASGCKARLTGWRGTLSTTRATRTRATAEEFDIGERDVACLQDLLRLRLRNALTLPLPAGARPCLRRPIPPVFATIEATTR
jgi:hypothetical protein